MSLQGIEVLCMGQYCTKIKNISIYQIDYLTLIYIGLKSYNNATGQVNGPAMWKQSQK